ncbi:MAG TPA: glycosyltransferase family 4 protein [Ramlibacter sp.]|nr:glycosyltransferase family 4 protein [Ramlibacter sp.]
MNILFVHQNFPGQFRHVAPELARQGHRVVALGVNRTPDRLPGVQHVLHQPKSNPEVLGKAAAPPLHELVSKMVRGDSAARAMMALRDEGFVPDVVFAHPGWGEAFYAKDVFPQARLLVYCEYYYGREGGDLGFDPEFTSRDIGAQMRSRLKNTHLLQAISVADAGLSPTQFQKAQHPDWFLDRITVLHDGIDTKRFVPDANAHVTLQNAGVTLRAGDEVLTFVARELEPYRGYHTFMRSLPLLQQLRPNARVVIVGGDGTSYGSPPPQGTTWKQRFLDEVGGQLDLSRVHFVGKLPHAALTALMQVSAAHVYLTYPFVLSWSLLEAMSIGCAIVASGTAPLREVIRDGENGFLTDFFDAQALARKAAEVLERRAELAHVRAAARELVVAGYDLQAHCLPGWVRFVTGATD